MRKKMTGLKLKIIVVDDDPIIGKLLARFLTEENYEVTSFTSGEKALNHLKTNEAVDLLLTDIDMPEMTGIELARQAMALYPALPIIVMSGSAGGEARDEIFSLGADFIPKPFDMADLLERVRIKSRLGGREEVIH